MLAFPVDFLVRCGIFTMPHALGRPFGWKTDILTLATRIE